MPKKMYESGPAMGPQGQSLTMGSGMGTGDSMESMMPSGNRPMPVASPKRKHGKKRK
jgi:hypothetical protein